MDDPQEKVPKEITDSKGDEKIHDNRSNSIEEDIVRESITQQISSEDLRGSKSDNLKNDLHPVTQEFPSDQIDSSSSKKLKVTQKASQKDEILIKIPQTEKDGSEETHESEEMEKSFGQDFEFTEPSRKLISTEFLNITEENDTKNENQHTTDDSETVDIQACDLEKKSLDQNYESSCEAEKDCVTLKKYPIEGYIEMKEKSSSSEDSELNDSREPLLVGKNIENDEMNSCAEMCETDIIQKSAPMEHPFIKNDDSSYQENQKEANIMDPPVVNEIGKEQDRILSEQREYGNAQELTPKDGSSLRANLSEGSEQTDTSTGKQALFTDEVIRPGSRPEIETKEGLVHLTGNDVKEERFIRLKRRLEESDDTSERAESGGGVRRARLDVSGVDEGRRRAPSEPPRVPPKTYMWEEVRRSRSRGGYPWTHLYKGSLDESAWRCFMEHEYEPISPRTEPLVVSTPTGRQAPPQRTFIRIPDSDQIIVPLHGSSDEEYNPDRYQDRQLVCQQAVTTEPTPIRSTPSPHPSPRPATSRPHKNITQKLTTNIRSTFNNISLPQKAAFKLNIEKPKFLTEKPKFLTEKPKFLTEKPKFLKEKPKFLTEKPKFLTEKPKISLPKRPNFLKERPNFKLPETKISMPHIKIPKIKRTRSARDSTTAVKSEYGSEKNIFETIKARTYPRFLNKRKRERVKKTTPPPTKFDSESLASTPQSKRNEKWVECYKGRKVEGEKENSEERNGESFHERYSKREAKRASSSSIVDSDREQLSSGSSTQRHRAGVIEEIDSDEFFVRVKGISREDVQVSRYLSTEIREAFRSPKNALASLDGEELDDEENEPRKPARSKAPKEYPRKEFSTLPARPYKEKKKEVPRRYRAKQASLPSLNTDNEKLPPQPPSRRKSNRDLTTTQHWSEHTQQQTVPTQMTAQHDVKVVYDEPVAPIRKARSQGTSLNDEDRTSRGAESIKSEIQLDDDINDEEFLEENNIPPSLKEAVQDNLDGNKRLNSDGSRYSNEKTSYELDLHSYDLDAPPKRPARAQSSGNFGYATVSKDKTKPLRPPPPKRPVQRQFQAWKTQGINFFMTYPRRAMKSLHRAPKRPTRNYSTIAGPSRPPRRSKVFREPVYVDGDLDICEIRIPFIDDCEESKEVKPEVTGEKMKGRPLPPPPRPPRKLRDLEESQLTTEEMNILNDLDCKKSESSLVNGNSETIIATASIQPSFHTIERDVPIRSSPKPLRPRRKSGSIDKGFTGWKPSEDREPKQESVSVTTAESTVSVQTDPLPEGFVVEDICTEPTPITHESDEEPSIEKYLEKYGQEIKMLGRTIVKPVAIRPETTEPKFVVPEKSSLDETKVKEVNDGIIKKTNVSKLSERGVSQSAGRNQEEKSVEEVSKEKPIDKKPVESKVEKGKINQSDILHLSQLDVDSLNVNTLKANHILVSDMSGQSLQVAELTSKDGNLVVSGMKFPPELVQSIASEIQARVAPQEELKKAAKPEKQTIMAGPPHVVVQTSAEVVSPPSPEVPSASASIPRPKAHRGRRSPTRMIDDSEDELAATMARPPPAITPPALPPTQQATPTATQLLTQLLSIWRGYLVQGFTSCYDTLNSVFPEGEKRRDAQTAACILFVLIAGLLALGFGSDHTVHHHHWDYIPPRR